MFGVGLLGLGALRGLWGFCTRVELGGLKTFCVFASIFPLLCLYFIRFSSSSPIFWGFAFVVLCFPSLCGLLPCLASALGLCVFFFPYGLYAKRKGAKVLLLASSLLGLSVVLDVLKHYRYFLRFIVPVSYPFAGDSGNLFGMVRWVVYYLPVVVNG